MKSAEYWNEELDLVQPTANHHLCNKTELELRLLVIAEIQRDAREGMVPYEDIRPLLELTNLPRRALIAELRAKHPNLFRSWADGRSRRVSEIEHCRVRQNLAPQRHPETRNPKPGTRNLQLPQGQGLARHRKGKALHAAKQRQRQVRPAEARRSKGHALRGSAQQSKGKAEAEQGTALPSTAQQIRKSTA